MGEIRSTLDIIMAKTRGLTMSDEEKKAFKERLNSYNGERSD